MTFGTLGVIGGGGGGAALKSWFPEYVAAADLFDAFYVADPDFVTLDETAVTAMDDVIGSRDLTAVDAPTYVTRFAAMGNQPSILWSPSGDGDRLTVPGDMARNVAGMTFFFVFRFLGTEQQRVLHLTDNGSLDRFSVDFISPARMRLRAMQADAGSVQALTAASGTALSINTNYVGVAQCDFATGASILRVNGATIASGTLTGMSGSTSDTASGTAMIGRQSPGGNRFNGYMPCCAFIRSTATLGTIEAREAVLAENYGITLP